MQDTMIYEQEQLLMAIDDIDDAQLVAEAAVISKMADLYLRQALIQESMTEEQFEAYFQEANKEDAQDGEPGKFAQFKDKTKGKFAAMGEKIKNFDAKAMLTKVLTAVKNIFIAIASGFMKFIRHLKPSYWAALIDVKSSELARIAKKEGCKLKVETDGRVTLMFLMPDFSLCERWLKSVEDYIESATKKIEKIREGKKDLSAVTKKLPRLPKATKYTKDENGNAKDFPQKWTSLKDFVSANGRADQGGGGVKTSITGKETPFDGLLKRISDVATAGPNGAYSKLGKLMAEVQKLPGDLYNAEGTDKARSGEGNAKKAAKAQVDGLISDLTALQKDAERILSACSSAYRTAINKADTIKAQLKDLNSEFYNKNKRGQALAANKEAYDKGVEAAGNLKGKAKKEKLDELQQQLNDADAETERKYAKRTERNARVGHRIDFED